MHRVARVRLSEKFEPLESLPSVVADIALSSELASTVNRSHTESQTTERHHRSVKLLKGVRLSAEDCLRRRERIPAKGARKESRAGDNKMLTVECLSNKARNTHTPKESNIFLPQSHLPTR